jgi:hypothetical protein
MYLGLLKKETITFTTNTTLAHRHPLFRGFLPGKRHAAQIASCDLGSISLFVVCVARTEAFLMASNTVILDVLGLTSMLILICLLS